MKKYFLLFLFLPLLSFGQSFTIEELRSLFSQDLSDIRLKLEKKDFVYQTNKPSQDNSRLISYASRFNNRLMVLLHVNDSDTEMKPKTIFYYYLGSDKQTAFTTQILNLPNYERKIGSFFKQGALCSAYQTSDLIYNLCEDETMRYLVIEKNK